MWCEADCVIKFNDGMYWANRYFSTEQKTKYISEAYFFSETILHQIMRDIKFDEEYTVMKVTKRVEYSETPLHAASVKEV